MTRSNVNVGCRFEVDTMVLVPARTAGSTLTRTSFWEMGWTSTVRWRGAMVGSWGSDGRIRSTIGQRQRRRRASATPVSCDGVGPVASTNPLQLRARRVAEAGRLIKTNSTHQLELGPCRSRQHFGTTGQHCCCCSLYPQDLPLPSCIALMQIVGGGWRMGWWV